MQKKFQMDGSPIRAGNQAKPIHQQIEPYLADNWEEPGGQTNYILITILLFLHMFLCWIKVLAVSE